MKKENPNIFKLVIYLYNTEKSNTFKTTHSFEQVKTIEEAFETIETFFSDNSKRVGGKIVYSDIKLAYYNGKLIVKEGKVL